MSTAIPTSTSVVESTVIRAPLSHVWHHIKLQDFANFWSALKSSAVVKDVSKETDVIRWSFKDGTVLEVKQEEHSVRNDPGKSEPPMYWHSWLLVLPDIYARVVSNLGCT